MVNFPQSGKFPLWTQYLKEHLKLKSPTIDRYPCYQSSASSLRNISTSCCSSIWSVFHLSHPSNGISFSEVNSLSSHWCHIRYWAQAIDNGKEVCALFFDLRKAFDSVPHRLLLDKLKTSGLNEHLVKWTFSYLHNRKQYVVLNGAESSKMPVLSGVPQDSVLGSLPGCKINSRLVANCD